MIICLDQRTGGGCGTENPDNAQHCRNCGRSLRYALQLMEADTVIGAYRVLRLIGFGGGGAVYQATDLRDNRSVAVKETFDPAGAQSFRDEFQALSRLNHPALPHYYELFEFNGSGFLAMEFIPGQSLQELVDDRGPIPEPEALGYLRQLCDVVAFLHSRTPPLLHRDIKPANVRLMANGTLKLVDFGLLKRGAEQTRKTIRGVGTPAYAPIEQYATTGQHTGVRSDIYSLGALAYHLLTGVTPPPATERAAVTPDPLVTVRVVNPAISAHVAAAVERAMALAQQDRVSSAEQFVAALFATAPVTVKLAEPMPPRPALLITGLQPGRTIQAHAEGIVCLALRGDGELAAAGSADDTATIWRLYDGERVARLTGHNRGVNGLAFTADGRFVASGSADATVKFWQVDDGRNVLTLDKHADWVLTVATSPDKQVLASGGADGMLWLWHMFDGLPIGSVQTGSGVWSIAWRPDGQRYATGHEDGRVQIRQSGDGRLLRTVDAHTNIVSGLAWSLDGSLLVTTSNDHTGMIWDAVSALPLRSLDGHTGAVTCVGMSPDGSAIATGCLDGSIRLFQTQDAQLIAEIEAHERGVNALLWHPDGHMLLSAGMDGTIRMWEVHKRMLDAISP